MISLSGGGGGTARRPPPSACPIDVYTRPCNLRGYARQLSPFIAENLENYRHPGWFSFPSTREGEKGGEQTESEDPIGNPIGWFFEKKKSLEAVGRTLATFPTRRGNPRGWRPILHTLAARPDKSEGAELGKMTLTG